MSEAFKEALDDFWSIRDSQGAEQAARGRQDAGTRGTVTAGKHMDDFGAAIRQIFLAEGIQHEFVQTGWGLSIPGFFRPTKSWDVVVCNGEELGALIELKSQVGSLGKNFNNRAEEAIGNAKDARIAFANDLLGTEQPFLGFLMVIEDGDDVASPRRTPSKFFTVDPELRNTPFVVRWERLLSRLVREQLYDATCLLPASRGGVPVVEIEEEVGLERFLARLVSRAKYLALRPGWT